MGAFQCNLGSTLAKDNSATQRGKRQEKRRESERVMERVREGERDDERDIRREIYGEGGRERGVSVGVRKTAIIQKQHITNDKQVLYLDSEN